MEENDECQYIIKLVKAKTTLNDFVFCQTFCIPIVIPVDREDKAEHWFDCAETLSKAKGRQLTRESQVTVPGSCVTVFLCFL